VTRFSKFELTSSQISYHKANFWLVRVMSFSRPSFVCDMCFAECVGVHEHSHDEISRVLRDFMLHVHLTETIEVLTDYLEQLNLNSEQIALVNKIYNFTVDLNNLPEVNNDRSCSIGNCDDTVDEDSENTSVFKDITNTVHITEFNQYSVYGSEFNQYSVYGSESEKENQGFKEYGVDGSEYDKENHDYCVVNGSESDKENKNSMEVKKRKQNSDDKLITAKKKRSIKCVRCQLQKKPCDYQLPCNRCLNARKNDMSCYYEH